MANTFNEKNYALFPSASNKKIVFGLEQNGAKIFQFPPVETEKCVLSSTEIEHLKNVANFDWIIFTDIFTVDYFLQNLEETGVDRFEMDAVRVCAFGDAVSDQLRFVQLHADVIPDSLAPENVFLSLLNYLNGEIKDLKFLVVKESFNGNEIKTMLEQKDASVFELLTYTARTKDKNEVAKLKTLIKGGAIDEFIFSAPADFVALQCYFQGEALTDLFADIKVSATSESAFHTAKEYNLRPLYFHF